MSRSFRLVIAAALALGYSDGSSADEPKEDPARLSVDRIFGSHEFESEPFSARWLPDSCGYTMLVPSEGPGGGRDLVQVDPANGAREVLIPASRLVPSINAPALNVDSETLSTDGSKLLIFTNSKRIWRTNSRGDYWVLDRTSRELRKLGGDAPPSSLMHAKFSPDASKVAFVRDNNLYVEDLLDRTVTRLTNSTSADEINGTFDWVYEEEFGLRDGHRWSPDGRSIAYWQIDTRGMREFPLVNNTAGLYPTVTWIKYPKVGEINPSCRVGVVDANGGETRWLEVPGDPREHYIASMEWAPGGRSPEVVIQQLNRLQNTVRVMLADPDSGKVRTILTEKDDAWVNSSGSANVTAGGISTVSTAPVSRSRRSPREILI